MTTLARAARALGGTVSSGQIVCPGPGHSSRDRSLAVRFDSRSPDGFVVTSFAGDDWRECRDHVRQRLGGVFHRQSEGIPQNKRRDEGDRVGLARWLWSQRRPIVGSPAEHYLREARCYAGSLPATLGYLPARGEHGHAMIAAYGMPNEPEPGILAIADDALRAVHITRLAPDGSGKDEARGPAKVTIASPIGCPIVLAPVNDLGGLAITEGIEDALSVHVATGLGAWAAGSAPFVPHLADVVPAYVEVAHVIVDDDPTGRRHASELVQRLRARGFEVIPRMLRLPGVAA